MNKLRTLAVLTVSAVLAGTTWSAAQPASKIAVVNSGRAFQESDEGKRIMALLQDRDTKIKNDLQKLDDAIRVLETKLSTAQLTMTQEALMAQQAELEKKKTERKRAEEDEGQEFTRLRASLMSKLQEEMVTILQALRKEKGYELIFDAGSGGIVDFDPALDITDELIRRHNASKAGAPPVKK
jgi:outer membrane protein